jgi:hypothetical protein
MVEVQEYPLLAVSFGNVEPVGMRPDQAQGELGERQLFIHGGRRDVFPVDRQRFAVIGECQTQGEFIEAHLQADGLLRLGVIFSISVVRHEDAGVGIDPVKSPVPVTNARMSSSRSSGEGYGRLDRPVR